MSRFSSNRYNRRVMVAMALYTAFMLLVWPLIQTVHSVPLKVLLAIAPLIPMVYVIALMGQRIRDSDELQQRTHLIGLGMATGVIAVLSLLGGFLAIAKLIPSTERC